MKKFIKSVVLFAVFASLFYGFAILVSGKLLPKRLLGNILADNKISAGDGSKNRFLSAQDSKKVDLLILGSSHAYRGYDTRIFKNAGITSYNLGSSAQPLNLTNFIYHKYNDRLSPKKLIIDIYPILLSNTGRESEVNLLPLFYQDYSFVGETFKNFDIRVLNSLIYFQVFGNPNAAKSKPLKDDEYVDGGYISSFKIAKESKKYNPTVLKIDENNIVALKNIVIDAEKKGIKVYLFQSPIPIERYKSFKNNNEVDSIMKSIGKYYNYNEVGALPKKYFFDDSHINQKGVDVYNKWVIEKINE